MSYICRQKLQSNIILGMQQIVSVKLRQESQTKFRLTAEENYLNKGISTNLIIIIMSAIKNIKIEILFMPCMYFIH